jgi:hypothetical protein
MDVSERELEASAVATVNEMPRNTRRIFQAYFILSVFQLIPAALGTFYLILYWGVLSTTAHPSHSTSWLLYVQDEYASPVDVRFAWPRIYLAFAGLVITPYLLLDVVASAGTFVGWKGWSGKQQNVELQVRARAVHSVNSNHLNRACHRSNLV